MIQANAEIIMLDGFICLYKSSVDLFFYVVLTAPLYYLDILISQPIVQKFFTTVCFDVFGIKHFRRMACIPVVN